MSPSTPAPRTVADLNVPRAVTLILTVYTLALTSILAFFAIPVPLSKDPLYLARVPWRLPLWISFVLYLSLFNLMMGYTGMFLPRTPITMIKSLINVGILAIGGPMAFTVWCVVTWCEDYWVNLTCTCLVGVFIAGLLAVWALLIREYGGQPDPQSLKPEGRQVQEEFG
jgi:hypothetical protein